MNEMMEKRNRTIDVAKGFGIILVVMGHSVSFLKDWIYLFHMPLFFFLSGYCYRNSYHQTWTDLFLLLKKRLQGLYLPFVKYGLLFVLLHNFFYHIYVYSNPEVWTHNKMQYFYSWNDWVHAILSTLAFARIEQLLNPFWFLPALFLATMGYAFFLFLGKTIKKIPFFAEICVIALFSISCLIGIQENKVLRIITISSLAMIPFSLGRLYHQYMMKKIPLRNPLVMAICLLGLFLGPHYGYLNMANFDFSSVPFFLIMSIMGIYIFLSVSCMFSESKKMIYIGQHTIEIMAWQYLSFKLISLFIIFFENRPIRDLGYATLNYGTAWDFLYAVCGVLIPLLLSELYKKSGIWGRHLSGR